MSNTKLRATTQINWDGTVDLGANNIKTTFAPTNPSDLTNKSYVDSKIDAVMEANNAMVFKGNLDCSANPDYPAANQGYTYRCSVSGKIGGASGAVVSLGDLIMCLVDNSVTGNQATVGANWEIVGGSNAEAVIPNLPITGATKTKVTYDEKGLVTAGADANTLDIVIDAPITVLGVTQGDYTNGSVITAGTTLTQVLKKMLQQRVLATYTAPTLTLATGITLAQEFGVNITPTWTPTWTQNDAGACSAFRIKKAGTTVYTNATPNAYAETSFQVTSASTAYTAEVDYADGVLKTDNFGDNSPTGRILAGTKISSALTLLGQRRYFWDTSTSLTTIPTSSADFRDTGLNILTTNSALNPVNDTQFTVTCNLAKRIIIAIPTSVLTGSFIGSVNEIFHIEGNSNYKDDPFIKTNFTINGANNLTGVDYTVYYWIPSNPFTGTFRVTI